MLACQLVHSELMLTVHKALAITGTDRCGCTVPRTQERLTRENR